MSRQSDAASPGHASGAQGSHPGPYSFNEVFAAELRALGRDPGVEPVGMADWDLLRRSWNGDQAACVEVAAHETRREQNLRDLFAAAAAPRNQTGATEPLAALCLSGGGIRSATFNLGVLQALARHGLLGRFDYLSSVSGGGYISAWLQAWRKNEGKSAAFAQLVGGTPAHVLAPEPKPIDHLRQFSNYLTPRKGLFAIDTWTAAAMFARNIFLNWLLLLPVLAAVVALPLVCFLVLQAPLVSSVGVAPWVVAALAFGLIGDVATFHFRRRRGTPADSARLVVAAALIPTWLSAVAVVVLATAMQEGAESAWNLRGLVPFAFAWLAVTPLVGWTLAALSGRRRPAAGRDATDSPVQGPEPASRSATTSFSWSELAGLLVSGSAAALLLVFATRELFPILYARPALAVTFALPALLLVRLVGRTALVAWFGLGEMRRWSLAEGADYDREWWARQSGWTLLALAVWVALSALALLALPAVRHFLPLIVPAGGASAIATWLLGTSGATASGRRDTDRGSRYREWALGAAVPVFCLSSIAVVGLGIAALGGYFAGLQNMLPPASIGPRAPVGWDDVALVAAVPAGLLAFGALMGFIVNVNRFSLHGLYRNRLVRAYLGASRKDRTPDPFTGFDPADNLPLSSLWDASTPAADQRPLPVYNATLNLSAGAEKLAWQQRKAESLSMSPLFVGNFHDGYRRAAEFGGETGITLGSAVAVSGAAANPNMGYHSSATVTFLLTLFNARLGAWVGNSGYAGEDTFGLPGPRWALRPLIAELMGQVNSRSPYVNVSDGGHFENLGLYEMVLRRCRYVVVSDCGQDGGFSFEDLGNAIRKVRIDFGVPIDFTDPIRIVRSDDEGASLYCALGRIRYAAVDGLHAPDGWLVYIKPSVYAKGTPVPYDVVSYGRGSRLFPHEPTMDQWFDESQFESYRALGFHALSQVCQRLGSAASIEELVSAAVSYVAAATTAGPAETVPTTARVQEIAVTPPDPRTRSR